MQKGNERARPIAKWEEKKATTELESWKMYSTIKFGVEKKTIFKMRVPL